MSNQRLNGWDIEAGRIKPVSDVALTPATAADNFATRRTGLKWSRARRPRAQPKIPPTRSKLSFEARNKVIKTTDAGATVGRGRELLIIRSKGLDLC